MLSRRLTAVCCFALCLSPARAATWRVSPDPCPAPAAAAAYLPEPDVVSPDARDGVRPGSRATPKYWPPAALTVEVPGAWAGLPAYVWFDGEMLDRLGESQTVAPGCSAPVAAPQ